MYDQVVARPGDWIPVPNRKFGTVWQLAQPEHCPNGHRLEYPNVVYSWTGCTCTEVGDGHHIASCLTAGCGGEVVFPPCTDETARAR